MIKDLILPYNRIMEQRFEGTDQAIEIFSKLSKDRKISFVDALSNVIITEDLKNIPEMSFDDDFRALGLTTISEPGQIPFL